MCSLPELRGSASGRPVLGGDQRHTRQTPGEALERALTDEVPHGRRGRELGVGVMPTTHTHTTTPEGLRRRRLGHWNENKPHTGGDTLNDAKPS